MPRGRKRIYPMIEQTKPAAPVRIADMIGLQLVQQIKPSTQFGRREMMFVITSPSNSNARQIRLSKSLTETLGKPRFVTVRTNGRYLVVTPCDESEQCSRRVNMSNEFGAYELLDFWDVKKGERFTATAYIDDGSAFMEIPRELVARSKARIQRTKSAANGESKLVVEVG